MTIRGWVALMLVGLLAARTAVAQGRLSDAPDPLVISRALDSIRADREGASRLRGESDGRGATAEARLAEATVQVELLKKDVTALDVQLKAAKKEKREADKTVLESDKKDLERRRELWERRRDLREAEMEYFRSEVAGADAAIKALDFEQQLERRRLEAGDARLLDELERKTLENRLDLENRRRDAADRRVRVVERQLAVQRAQIALTSKR